MQTPRSLAKDKNDITALHSPRWRDDEPQQASMFREHVPFFYSRAGSPLSLEGHYRGAHAFLMANGPSLGELDLTPLQSRWSMTLNNGPRTFRGNANCSVDDPSRFSLSIWLDPTIMKFIPMSQFEKPLWDNRLLKHGDAGSVQHWEKSTLRVGHCPNVVGYRRNEKFHAPRWLWEETINWGNHTKYGGGRSVLLASLRILFLLGFRQVYLMGVDFEMTESKRYHFSENRSDASIRGNMSTYAKMQQWFLELQPHFLKAGFKVFNCNPNSRLTAFPHMPYQEALDASLHHIGDFKRERTEGMYQKLEDKAGVPEQKSVEASQAGETARREAEPELVDA